jgi:hypothetical protein
MDAYRRQLAQFDPDIFGQITGEERRQFDGVDVPQPRG